MALPSPIPAELAEVIAQRLRAIGDPMRIRALDLLRDGERSVAHTAQALGTSQQNASKHLAVLSQAGLVQRRKSGTTVWYSVADQSVFDLCEQVCGSIQRQLTERAALMEGAAPAGR
ncbi:ArsR/SmtB family transcription factor [Paraconexibacter sp.]|uniref:ArsR/SmtB family transcription factor n=1 Tax=Paraconexibacter sp. TaxID=2949640 RepID=UPI0035645A37